MTDIHDEESKKIFMNWFDAGGYHAPAGSLERAVSAALRKAHEAGRMEERAAWGEMLAQHGPGRCESTSVPGYAVGDPVRSLHSDQSGSVVAITPAGPRVRWDDGETLTMHGQLHVRPEYAVEMERDLKSRTLRGRRLPARRAEVDSRSDDDSTWGEDVARKAPAV